MQLREDLHSQLIFLYTHTEMYPSLSTAYHSLSNSIILGLSFRPHQQDCGRLLADGVGEAGVCHREDHQVCGAGETQVRTVLARRWQYEVRKHCCTSGPYSKLWRVRPQDHQAAVKGRDSFSHECIELPNSARYTPVSAIFKCFNVLTPPPPMSNKITFWNLWALLLKSLSYGWTAHGITDMP